MGEEIKEGIALIQFVVIYSFEVNTEEHSRVWILRIWLR